MRMQLPIHQKQPLPFDCHNHIQLGLTVDNVQHWSFQQVGCVADARTSVNNETVTEQQQKWFRDVTINSIRGMAPNCCGMALMSTHPRDFDIIQLLSTANVMAPSSTQSINEQPKGEQHQQLQQEESFHFQIVPCFGLHPWFIHELTDTNWQSIDSIKSASTTKAITTVRAITELTSMVSYRQNGPQWMYEMECHIRDNPKSIIGEIGLDKFHYALQDTPGTIGTNHEPQTKQLTTPIDQQIRVFQLQMEIAIQYNRPVCIHCVHAFGPLLDILTKLRDSTNVNNSKKTTKSKNDRDCGLPPKIYFHSYGGKIGTVAQILSICEGINNKTKMVKNQQSTTGTKCFFGFSPIVNFRSPKTIDIIRCIGLSRLLLETDLDDISRVSQSLQDSIQYVAKALDIEESIVIEQTTKNAIDFYNLPSYAFV
jgi:Tat protein secretion system quality control protein TatD with DNase activity